jgi:hypothetical protein
VVGGESGPTFREAARATIALLRYQNEIFAMGFLF